MRIINVDTARVIQLFSKDEINPKNGAYRPDVINAIAERYRFVQTPPVIIAQAPNSTNTKFSEGQFIEKKKKINIANLTIYVDGIAVETTDTDSADIVMDDFIAWAKKEFGINEPTTKIARSYISGIVVDFDASIDSVFSIISEMGKIVSDQYKKTYGESVNLGLSRIGLGSDEQPPPGMLNSDFLIERRIGNKFSINRYFAGAPLPTDVHINLLEQFERLALGR